MLERLFRSSSAKSPSLYTYTYKLAFQLDNITNHYSINAIHIPDTCIPFIALHYSNSNFQYLFEPIAKYRMHHIFAHHICSSCSTYLLIIRAQSFSVVIIRAQHDLPRIAHSNFHFKMSISICNTTSLTIYIYRFLVLFYFLHFYRDFLIILVLNLTNK